MLFSLLVCSFSLTSALLLILMTLHFLIIFCNEEQSGWKEGPPIIGPLHVDALCEPLCMLAPGQKRALALKYLCSTSYLTYTGPPCH